MDRQADLLDAIDWRAPTWLIILDGCRADELHSLYAEYLRGTYVTVHNGGPTFTADWFAARLSGAYPVPFFHGGQPIYAFDHNTSEYDERDHFADVPPWRAYRWGNEFIDTSIPSGVNGVVRAFATPRSGGVVRYLQPHNPYRELPGVHSREDAAEYDSATLRAAYRDNLRWGLEAVAELVEWVEGDVIVTADHGQAFGEACCGQYLHAPWYVPCECLTRVPWLEIR